MPSNQRGHVIEPATPRAGDVILQLSPRLRVSTGQRRRWYLLPAVLLAAAAALAVDCSLSQWCLQGGCPKLLEKIFLMAEVFGHGLGVLAIIIVIHQLSPARRWALPRVLLCSLGAGLAANVIKMTVVRLRPHHFQFDGNVWATFGDWFPLATAGSGGQSFPSAHAATAAGLAVALIWLYPTGRRLWPALAVLVACQRVAQGAHYPSDVLIGAVLGIVVARTCLRNGGLLAWLDRLEDRFKGTERPAPVLLPMPGNHAEFEPAGPDEQRRSRTA